MSAPPRRPRPASAGPARRTPGSSANNQAVSSEEAPFKPRRRPQSASLASRKRVEAISAAGGGAAAVRLRRKKKQRPRTAPVRGRKAGFDETNPDCWLQTLQKNGLLEEPLGSEYEPIYTVSHHYLQEDARRKRKSNNKLLEDIRVEQNQYEKITQQRMAEATRWAQYLDLRRKYNPIYIRADETSGAPGSVGRMFGYMGELRCEIVAKEDSQSRIISCALFDREYERLQNTYNRKLKEDKAASAKAKSLALVTSNNGAETERALTGRRQPFKHTTTRRILAITNGATTKGSSPTRVASTRDSSKLQVEKYHRGDPAQIDEVTRELHSVLDEISNMDQALRSQQQLLKDNGWNIKFT